MKMVRIDGSLFFGAIPHVQRALRSFRERVPGQKFLMILASGINFIDLSGAEFLADEAKTRQATGGGVFLYRAKSQVMNYLERSGHIDAVGQDVRGMKSVTGRIRVLRGHSFLIGRFRA